MKYNFKNSTIGDACLLVTDGSHFSPKSVEHGEYMVSVKDFTPYGFDFDNCRQISANDYEKLKKSGCIPQYEDILIGKDGARYFEDIVVYRQTEQPALLSSIAILRCNTNELLPDYLYYMMINPAFKQNVRDNYGSGSAIPRIILKDFKRMPISYPSIKVQQRIISILRGIDAKIELNSKINANLQQQAQAIFKSWFVDFEPFDGVQPECWEEVPFGQLVHIGKKSFNPAKEPEILLEHYSIPAYDEMKYPVFELSTNIKSNKFLVDKDCFLISKLNPTTKRVWRPYCLSEHAVCSTEFIVYRAKNRAYTDFLYSVVDSELFSAFMCSHVTGSTGSRQRTTPSETLNFPLVLPTPEVIERFTEIVNPMYAKMKECVVENQKLKQLRDGLLPKLMSGEIPV